MLTHEENELISRVGPGTPMGNLMREYWLPAMVSSELPTPDSDPVRVLLLGEKLIAFRDSAGKVGLVANNCPHRGASLFFGRNEEQGLRCVYHGWKFDTAGNCIDMPNEPAESDFRHKVKATSYPTQERGGVVWAYMGPRNTPPPLPDLEPNMRTDMRLSVRVTQQESNWLQVLEGDIDTVHAGFLHGGSYRTEDMPDGTFRDYMIRDRTARFEVINTDCGALYGAYRDGPPGYNYWRLAYYLFPFYDMPAPGLLGHKVSCICRVPMDDQHTLSFFMNAHQPDVQPEVRPTSRSSGRVAGGRTSLNSWPGNAAAETPQQSSAPLAAFPGVDRFGGNPTLPNTSDWLGRFRTKAGPANDFFLDRDIQRRNEGHAGFSGIPGGAAMQDAAITWSMGPIYQRQNERLGTTDVMIIRVRRRLIAAATALAEQGVLPPGVDNPEVYRVRSGGVFLPKNANWVNDTEDLRRAFVTHPELDPALTGDG